MRRTRKGFTLAELAIVLVVVGLLIGGVIKGAQLVKQSKMKRQANDLSSLVSACELYYDRVGRLPGDRNRDGNFDGNNQVWDDLEYEDLADRNLMSPYGGGYSFRYGWFANRQGNYVRVRIPARAGQYVDKMLDDGNPWDGVVRCQSGYSTNNKVDVAHFIFIN